MHSLAAFTLLAVSTGVWASGLVNVPFNVSSVQPLGIVSDAASNPDLGHDGGGGATQAGYHVMVFADSQTNKPGFSFAHNNMAYFGYRDTNNLTDLYMFGMGGPAGNKTLKGPIVGPMPNSNETALGADFSIWAWAGVTALPDNKTVVGVWPALNEGSGGGDLYSTMVTIDIVDPTTVPAGSYPPASRIAPQLFYPNEVNYGSFATYAHGGYLYLLGSDNTGIKIARVTSNLDTIADRTKYQYFNGSSQTWVSTLMSKNDASTNLLSWTSQFFNATLHPSAGDFFFSPYHNTFVLVFSDSGVDGAFRASYSTSGEPRGPWTKPVTIYSPPVPSQCSSGSYDYDAHVHYGVDPSGATLLLSYSSCATYVSMARLSFA